MSKQVKVTAPGKLMLFGEHAVVHGKPCIVTAVDQRVEITASFNGEDTLVVNAPQLGIQEYRKKVAHLRDSEMPKQVSFIEAATLHFYLLYGLKKGLDITTYSQFSHTYGFGSSSAITIGTIRALSQLYQIPLTNKEIFDIAYQAVVDIQGVGSGFDLAAALWGGTLYFTKGAKIVRPLPLGYLPLVVCYSGVKADTPTLVRQIEELKRQQPGKIDNIFSAIEKITLQAEESLTKGDWPAVGQLMVDNHRWLEKLGVSTRKLEKLVKAALDNGAYGAKLSGAGGGDCMIALVEKKNKQAVEEALTKAGGLVLPVKLNTSGVTCQTK
jgi:mevalonate kinase